MRDLFVTATILSLVCLFLNEQQISIHDCSQADDKSSLCLPVMVTSMSNKLETPSRLIIIISISEVYLLPWFPLFVPSKCHSHTATDVT
jgi:hypothetical protein